MARKNHLLVVSLLVMVGALIGGILWNKPASREPGPAVLDRVIEDVGVAEPARADSGGADAQDATARTDVEIPAGASEMPDSTPADVAGGCSIAGQIVDELARPIGGVDVGATQGRMGIGIASHRATSGVDGRFQLDVPPGEWQLLTASNEWLPGRARIEVALDESVDDVVIELRRGASLTGVVVDDLERPIAGARVAPFRVERMDPGTTVDRVSAAEAIVTDTAGRFSLGSLEPGSPVRLRAWAEGHEASVATAVAGEGQDVRMRLSRRGAIKGVLRDAAGQPVADSEVVAEPTGAPTIVVIDASDAVRTAADGTFEIFDVAPGMVRVVATGAGHRRVESDAVEVRAGETTSVRLTAETGAAVVVTVLDAANAPIAGAKVSVTSGEVAQAEVRRDIRRSVRREVRQGGGPGGPVVVLGDEPESLGSGTTDAEGRVVIGGLEAGPVAVRASHPEHASGRPVQIAIPRAGEVEAQLTMRPAGEVAVTALDADRQPLPQAAIRISGPHAPGETADEHEATSDSEGRARVGPVAPGSYTAVFLKDPSGAGRSIGGMEIVLAGSGGSPLSESAVNFDVVAGRTAEVELVFPILAMLSGVVTDASGPVTGIDVRVESNAEPTPHLPFGEQMSARTDGGGRYAIEGVPAGDYTLSWGRRGALIRHEAPLAVGAGQRELQRDLVISGGTLRVSAASSDGGEPIEGALVSLTRAGSDPATPEPRPRRVMMISMAVDSEGGNESMSMNTGGPATVETDEEGVAVITDVPPGTYRVTVRDKRHADGVIEAITVADGAEVASPAVLLDPGGFLTGRVTGFDASAGFQIAMVEVLRVGDDEPRRETAMNGAVKVNGLRPGAYRVRARALGQDAGDEFGPWVDVQIEAGERARIDVPVK